MINTLIAQYLFIFLEKNMIHFVIKTNKFIPKRFSAYTVGPFILIRPEKANNIPLLEHEKHHVKQWWQNPFMGIFYRFSKKYRYKYELAAHRVQLSHDPTYETAQKLTIFLVENYNLDIEYEKTYQDLIKDILK